MYPLPTTRYHKSLFNTNLEEKRKTLPSTIIMQKPYLPEKKEAEIHIKEIEKHFLSEGRILITTVPMDIITVLGSCVSVCLWDDTKKIAGMNHFLLPGDLDDDRPNFSRGVYATKMLIKSMLNRKCRLDDLEAKIFGGSNSINQFEVGKGNIEIAVKILKEAGIPIIARHTGGSFGRKVIFNTRTGKVLMKVLNKSLTELNDEIARGLAV